MRTETKRLEHIARRLRRQGYRVTPQRMAILQAVLSSRSHPTVEEIHQRVAAQFPMISPATVYKTLKVLKELGEVTELTTGRRSRYEGSTFPHLHLICMACHSITDLPIEIMHDLPRRIREERRFHATRYDMAIYGLCARCQEAQGEPIPSEQSGDEPGSRGDLTSP
ncbi:MAG: transcriptional repressor [Chloroflexi bacterium]|nr:transcriptional repressor [Chloroflexota bacterium]